MKKSILFAVVLLMTGLAAQAQKAIRIGYVDMEYILQNIPEYQEASSQLEAKVQKWKTEIDTELAKVESMRLSLENEKPLLTSELIEEREEEIEFEQKKIFDYQQKRFGPNGDLMTQKLQLVKPIQDQVFIAVQEIATNRKYDLIFDKSADVVMLYASEALDVSDQVLRSITRASSREQANSRSEREEIAEEESRTVEEEALINERESAKEQRNQERQAVLEERKKERDSLKAARQKAFEERRAKVLEERQRKKDSVAEAKKRKED